MQLLVTKEELVKHEQKLIEWARKSSAAGLTECLKRLDRYEPHAVSIVHSVIAAYNETQPRPTLF